MPRRARSIVGGYAYHVLNRANGRLRLFKKPADFADFEMVLADVLEIVPLRILGYVVIPARREWHFVVWPRRGQADGSNKGDAGQIKVTRMYPSERGGR